MEKTNGLSFKKLFYSKRFLVVLSVVISVIIWFVAAIVRNPVRQKQFVDVSAVITLKDTAAEKSNLSIISDVSDRKFTVTVEGPAHIVSRLKKEDFVIKADVSAVNEPNENCVLKMVAEKSNANISGYEFLSVEPSTVTVKVDRISTKEFDLVPKVPTPVVTDTASGLVADDPELYDLTQNKIKITGPETSLAQIKAVAAMADYDGSKITKTKTYDAKVVLLDAEENTIYKYDMDGNVLDKDGNKVLNPSMTPEFTKTKVTLGISKKVVLRVNPIFINNNDKREIDYSVTPETATVIGPPDIVSQMTSVDLEPIDFNVISVDYSNRVFKVKANLTETVKIEGDKNNATEFVVRIKRIK